MNDKQLATILKPIASKVAWLGGSLALITAILSAIGFLVLQSYQDLLGIAGFVPLPADSWSIEGGRFVYNSLMYLVAGVTSQYRILLLIAASILLLLVLLKKTWVTTLQTVTKSSVVKLILLGISLFGLLWVITFFAQYQEPANLLVVPQQYDHAIAIRSADQGMRTLRIQYAFLTAMLLFAFVWLTFLAYILNPPQEESAASPSADAAARSHASSWNLGLIVLWAFFLIPLVYLPMNYGKMAKSGEFLKVRLFRKLEDAQPDAQHVMKYEGWLLHQDGNILVLFKGPGAEPIHVLKRGDFAQIQILSYGNIFADQGRVRNVFLGEWQPPTSGTGRGFFVPLESFTPGRKLAAKMALEQPGETVKIALKIEFPDAPLYETTYTVQDNSEKDLSPQEDAVIVMELIEIPEAPVRKYLVEVQDSSGKKPMIAQLDVPAGPSGALSTFGQTVSQTASALWNLPGSLSAVLVSKERELSPILRTLVLANVNGEPLNTFSIQQGELAFPIWLPTNQILVVERRGLDSSVKVISTNLAPDTYQDFGGQPIEGTEPYFAPNGQVIVFRQDTKLMSVHLDGTELTPLIQDHQVTQILGIFPENDEKIDNIVFVAKQPETDIYDQWLAKIQGGSLLSVNLLPYDAHWELLSRIRLNDGRMLFEQQDSMEDNRKTWNIYLSQSPQAEGVKITTDDYNDRYPAWSSDGANIVYVSE